MKERPAKEFASPVLKKRFARRNTTFRPFTFARNFETQAESQNQIIKQVGDRGVVISTPVQLQSADEGTSITDIVRQSPVPVIIAHAAPKSKSPNENREVEDDDPQDFAVTPRRSRRSHEPSTSFLSRHQYPLGTPQSAKSHRTPDEHYIGSQTDSNIDEEVSFAGEDEESPPSKSRKNLSRASTSSALAMKGGRREVHSSNTSSSKQISARQATGSGKRKQTGKQQGDDSVQNQKAASASDKGSSQKRKENSSVASLQKRATPTSKPAVEVLAEQSSWLGSSQKMGKENGSAERSTKKPEKGAAQDTATRNIDKSSERAKHLDISQDSSQIFARRDGDKEKSARWSHVDNSDRTSGLPPSGRWSRNSTFLSKSGTASSVQKQSCSFQTNNSVADSSMGRSGRRQQKVLNQTESDKNSLDISGIRELSASPPLSSSTVRSTRKRTISGHEEAAEERPSPEKRPKNSKAKETPKRGKVLQSQYGMWQKQSDSSVSSLRGTAGKNSAMSHNHSQAKKAAASSTAEALTLTTAAPVTHQAVAKSNASNSKQGGQRRFFTDPERRTPQTLAMQRKVAMRKPAKKRTPLASTSFWKTTRKVPEKRREQQQQLDISMSSVYDDETFGEEFEPPPVEEGPVPSISTDKEGRWSRVQRQLQGRTAAAELEKKVKRRQGRDVTELDVIADMLEDTEMVILENSDMSSACKSAVHKEFTFVRKQIQQTMLQVTEMKELTSSINKLKSHFRALNRESRENHQQKCLLLKKLQTLKRRGVDADMKRIDSWLQDFQALRQMCARPAP